MPKSERWKMEVGQTWVRTVISVNNSCLKTLSVLLKLSNFHHPESLSVGGTKVFVMPGGMMKSNANLVELIEKVKPEIRTLIEKCNTVSCNRHNHKCL